MTEQEALEILEEVKQLDDILYAYSSVYMEALEVALSVLREIQNYRKLGTLEELARAKKYIDLAKKHGTIGEMIDECAEYEAIGTVEECREAVEKQKVKYIKIESYCPAYCPTCRFELSESLGYGYYEHFENLSRCPKCGQKICWDEDLEEMEDE